MHKPTEDKSAKHGAPTRPSGTTSRETLLERAPALLWAADSELRFTAIAGAESQNVRDHSPYAGTPIQTAFFFKSPDSQDAHQRARQGESTNFEIELSGRCLSCRVVPLRAPEGEIVGIIGVAIDCTSLSENVAERNQPILHQREPQEMQAVSQLAGGVAHAFNNLLMVIKGQTELMLGEVTKPHIHRRLEEVMRASERASSLTTQLLALSRSQVVQNAVLDVNQLIKHMAPLLPHLIPEGIKFAFTPSRKPASVKADVGQLEQVITNLVVNACDAMPQGGRLSIEVSNVFFDGFEVTTSQSSKVKYQKYVLIVVRDTGTGMSDSTRSRIFEPFFTTKEPGSGTGLGLSLVYGVVQQSGGQIQVESEVEKGTTIKLYLPRVPDPEPEPPLNAVPTPLKASETILYAEDEASVRELVTEYLTELGYRILPACDGVVAMQIAQSHSGAIDLLLTDVTMPKMGGQELAEELRKSLPALRVIFVSGYVGRSVVGKNLDLPEVLFLSKPFSMHSLAKAIRGVLDK